MDDDGDGGGGGGGGGDDDNYDDDDCDNYESTTQKQSSFDIHARFSQRQKASRAKNVVWEWRKAKRSRLAGNAAKLEET